ncbi:class D sortase [Lederbergia lenta]|uniref:class D sortase n=1 Tax=Lederbergia lenta TaxID=1467 RepID=UPI00203E3437|nr:class D sortase [Lederbergia lenta]MCM3112944.1 class D sortase [Lederbergia lenta]
MKNTKFMIGIVFSLAGLTLILFPLYQEWQQGKELRALEDALSLISESNGADVDLSAIEDLSLTEDQLKGVLELEIPTIGLKQKVLEETTEDNLNIALTQIKREQVPGFGNFTIAGHRGYRDKRHFSRLPKVKVGEKVYLYAGNKTFVYEVTSSSKIEPTAVETLDDREDKNEITLITCTVTGSDRIAVKGELIETIED